MHSQITEIFEEDKLVLHSVTQSLTYTDQLTGKQEHHGNTTAQLVLHSVTQSLACTDQLTGNTRASWVTNCAD